jgi:hypothetical protein
MIGLTRQFTSVNPFLFARRTRSTLSAHDGRTAAGLRPPALNVID